MPEDYEHHVTAWWSSGRGGFAKSASAPNSIHVAAPAQFGGLEGRWTPEELLLGAVATCFMTTFRILAEKSRFGYLDLEIEVKGTVQKQKRMYKFTGLVVAPRLKIQGSVDPERAARLLEKARRMCLISRALRVPQVFEPCIEMRPAVAVAEQKPVPNSI